MVSVFGVTIWDLGPVSRLVCLWMYPGSAFLLTLVFARSLVSCPILLCCLGCGPFVEFGLGRSVSCNKLDLFVYRKVCVSRNLPEDASNIFTLILSCFAGEFSFVEMSCASFCFVVDSFFRLLGNETTFHSSSSSVFVV